MPKASEVAMELRRVADALDAKPETNLVQPMLSFYCNSYGEGDKGKAIFLATARLLPRPLNKEFDGNSYEIEHGKDGKSAVWVRACISRENVCELVEPAKPAVYRCEPLLSEAEDEAITA